jgi:hypothetical protein
MEFRVAFHFFHKYTYDSWGLLDGGTKMKWNSKHESKALGYDDGPIVVKISFMDPPPGTFWDPPEASHKLLWTASI